MAAASFATTEKIGFLTRTLALIIDTILLAIVSAILNAIVFGLAHEKPGLVARGRELLES